MRKCIRCDETMIEHCSIKVEGAAYGIVMATDDKKIFANRIGKPQVAICPKCGEISMYIENPEAIKSE